MAGLGVGQYLASDDADNVMETYDTSKGPVKWHYIQDHSTTQGDFGIRRNQLFGSNPGYNGF